MAHARLPDEALGTVLSDALNTLARCDKDFTAAVGKRARDAFDALDTLRPADRDLVRALVTAADAAARATDGEPTLDAAGLLDNAADAICKAATDAPVCQRANAIARCSRGRAGSAQGIADAYRAASKALDEVDGATGCEVRSHALLNTSIALTKLTADAQTAHLAGGCVTTASGLSCATLPELTKRSKALVSDAQDRLYRECYCPALLGDRGTSLASRTVVHSLRCDVEPEEVTLAPPVEGALRDEEAIAYAGRRISLVPAYSPAQCPACTRLARQLDEQLEGLSRPGAESFRAAQVLLSEVHARAQALMAGEFASRCAARPDDWGKLVKATELAVDSRRPAAESARKLADLRTALDTLPCVRGDVAPAALIAPTSVIVYPTQVPPPPPPAPPPPVVVRPTSPPLVPAQTTRVLTTTPVRPPPAPPPAPAPPPPPPVPAPVPVVNPEAFPEIPSELPPIPSDPP